MASKLAHKFIGLQWNDAKIPKHFFMVTWGFAVYNVGVMGIWFSVPGAMWKARCLMIGMSRWWTIATWNKESENITIIKKVKYVKVVDDCDLEY